MAEMYERVGGARIFVRLVDGFYDRVEEDPVLRPLYPQGEQGMRLAASIWQCSCRSIGAGRLSITKHGAHPCCVPVIFRFA